MTRSILDAVATDLTPLDRAHRLQAEAARVGFDWPNAASMIEKLGEETAELAQACDAGDKEAEEEEIGDLLFVLVNLARFLQTDAGRCLEKACAKFERRLRALEARLHDEGRRFEDESLERLDALWREVKDSERNA
jgi:ATP diphosphatase